MAWLINTMDKKMFFIAFLLILGGTMEFLKLPFGETIVQGTFFAGLALIDPNRPGPPAPKV